MQHVGMDKINVVCPQLHGGKIAYISGLKQIVGEVRTKPKCSTNSSWFVGVKTIRPI